MPFGDLGFAELVVLLVFGLFVFGPERLPEVAAKAGRGIRDLRRMAEGWSSQLREELPEVGDLDLRSLNPRTMVSDALFGDDEPTPSTAPRSRAAAGPSPLGAPPVSRPLQPWEPAPFDPDAT